MNGRNWNTFWESAARRTADGWEAEIRIPFSSLRFKSEDGRVVMGVLCWRSISRKSELAVYPALNGELYNSHRRPSLAEDMQLQGVSASRQLLLTPYVLGGMSQHTEVAGPEDVAAGLRSIGYGVVDSREAQAGLDLKWGLSSDVTLDLTVNTDFAQVETDDALVNLSRFSLFRPEKRLFFQERAGVFEHAVLRLDREVRRVATNPRDEAAGAFIEGLRPAKASFTPVGGPRSDREWTWRLEMEQLMRQTPGVVWTLNMICCLLVTINNAKGGTHAWFAKTTHLVPRRVLTYVVPRLLGCPKRSTP